MLGNNIRPVQVALACGVTESYVSQLLSDPEVEKQVVDMRVILASKHVDHDNLLDRGEDAALKKVVEMIPMIMRSQEALAVFTRLNAARRRAGSGPSDAPNTSVLVTLDLPEAAQVHFKITTDRQVIEVAGRSMTPMPAAQVAKLLSERKTQKLLESSLAEPIMLVQPAMIDLI